VVAVALGALVLGLILFAPRALVPDVSQADLRDVPDAAKWQARDSRIQRQNEVRAMLLQGLGGLAVVLAAIYTYQQVQTGRRQLHIAQQGQVTERFTRAIDQLGSDHLDVQLGGIYALERIARDSPEDRATIAEVLTAYIRRHAPWPPRLDGQPPAEAAIEDVPELQVRAPDVQASLTVLGRGGFADRQGLEDQLDLHSVDLRKAYLGSANLVGANLYGANLAGADLWGVDLRRANLLDANLAGAHIIGCDFAGAELGYATLEKAFIDGPSLGGATIGRANLSGARLERAEDLEDASLEEAVADGDTTWPYGFDWVMAGVRLNGELAERFKWR